MIFLTTPKTMRPTYNSIKVKNIVFILVFFGIDDDLSIYCVGDRNLSNEQNESNAKSWFFLFNSVHCSYTHITHAIDFNKIKMTGPFGDFHVLMAHTHNKSLSKPNTKKTVHLIRKKLMILKRLTFQYKIFDIFSE